MTPIEQPHEECGIIGIAAPGQDVARLAFWGLGALQHRGQEAAGIAVSDGEAFRIHKDVGLVTQVFNPDNLAALRGCYAIGHTRYSTTGLPSLRNAQPFLVETPYGLLAVAHNGNLINAATLRDRVLRRGATLAASSDSEIIAMMLASSEGSTWNERIQNTMPEWRGAYSIILLTRDRVLAVRDPWGFRPLSIGHLLGGGYVAASESGALCTIGCEFVREVEPGEIVTLSQTSPVSSQGMRPALPLARCVFEHIYFSRADSYWDGLRVHQVRQRLGEMLAREAPADGDIVIGVPDTAVPAAIGYARASGIPYNDGFVKNGHIGRTFIQPTLSLRQEGVRLKFTALAENLRGKRVVMVDDSIVRGNTAGPLVEKLRNAGAREVHVRIASPPVAYPCFMGVDMGPGEDLIANRMGIEEIRSRIHCDTLRYLSVHKMMQAIGRKEGYCCACFTGVYPIKVDVDYSKTEFEKVAL